MQADNVWINRAIQRARGSNRPDNSTFWVIVNRQPADYRIDLTPHDARCIIECLRESDHITHLSIENFRIHNAAVLNILSADLPSCKSVTTVFFWTDTLEMQELDRLRPILYNTSVTSLRIYSDGIQGRTAGNNIRALLVDNKTLKHMDLDGIPIGPEAATGVGQGMAGNSCLQLLDLTYCHLGNGALTNLLGAVGLANNNSLTRLLLSGNDISGAEGGQQISWLLQRFRQLKQLNLDENPFGPLGARALGRGLTSPHLVLEDLSLYSCNLGSNGAADLIPDGQVNTSLTTLDIGQNNIQGSTAGGDAVLALATRCTKVHQVRLGSNPLCPFQHQRLRSICQRAFVCEAAQGLDVDSPFPDLLDAMVHARGEEFGLSAIFVILQNHNKSFCQARDRAIGKRLAAAAQALRGSPFPVLFQVVEEAVPHELGLSAVFEILQNDGEGYFCGAQNRNN